MDPLEKQMSRRFEALGWALFFLWFGIYLILDLQKDGIFAIGLGIIIVGENALRHAYAIPASKFWQIIGVLFLAVGILDFFNIRLLPFLLICCGLMILFRYVIRDQNRQT